MRTERLQRGVLVGTHQTAVADNIGREDCSQFAFHGSLSPANGLEDNPKDIIQAGDEHR